ncbi:hypothetical protein KY290_015641 [Solanum tuberosum]|uniref:GAG-pre-integrase domain-containing protein n=1 Tax=Solanum tuberosum TaxID=4113 RepID=A0ABQ7VV59_SOLTU|nr:hypothetical protein KY290_015641 [Solanum tuberosum]
MLMVETKEYQRPGGEKDIRRDPIPDKRARKGAADYVVKKVFTVWDASMLDVKDNEDVFDGMFAFMAKFDDEKDEEKDSMNNSLDIYNEEKLALVGHVSVIEEQLKLLETENLELKEKLKMLSEKSGKGNEEASSLQLELEASMNTVETILALALERNDQMETDMGSGGSSSQCWFMDSGCSKHMTRETENFLSLKALQSGSVSFGNGKKGYILGVGRIGKSLEHSIENVYYVSGLKYSLLSVSLICDKGNEVRFLLEKCIVTNLPTKEVILTARRCKNMYMADLDTAQGDNLTCLSAQSENANLWHRMLGHVSSFLLNKLVSRDLVRGLPKLKFSDDKVCDACVKGKQTRSSFNIKKQVGS